MVGHQQEYQQHLLLQHRMYERYTQRGGNIRFVSLRDAEYATDMSTKSDGFTPLFLSLAQLGRNDSVVEIAVVGGTTTTLCAQISPGIEIIPSSQFQSGDVFR